MKLLSLFLSFAVTMLFAASLDKPEFWLHEQGLAENVQLAVEKNYEIGRHENDEGGISSLRYWVVNNPGSKVNKEATQSILRKIVQLTKTINDNSDIWTPNESPLFVCETWNGTDTVGSLIAQNLQAKAEEIFNEFKPEFALKKYKALPQDQKKGHLKEARDKAFAKWYGEIVNPCVDKFLNAPEFKHMDGIAKQKSGDATQEIDKMFGESQYLGEEFFGSIQTIKEFIVDKVGVDADVYIVKTNSIVDVMEVIVISKDRKSVIHFGMDYGA